MMNAIIYVRDVHLFETIDRSNQSRQSVADISIKYKIKIERKMIGVDLR